MDFHTSFILYELLPTYMKNKGFINFYSVLSQCTPTSPTSSAEEYLFLIND